MRADDDTDAELDLRHRSFGPMSGDARDYWREELLACVQTGRQFGVWDGRQLLGTARYYDMRQYWHGRPVPMAGVGGVKVAPEARGRGVGRALMTALLTAIADQGFALSVLYPATAQIYRSLGWELAGGNYRAEVPGRTLGSMLPPDPLLLDDQPGQPGEAARPGTADVPPAIVRATPEDAERVIATVGAVHAAALDCGPATRDAASVRRWLADPDMFFYLAEDGFLGYRWHGGTSKAILVEFLQACSARTVKALWRIVASHSSVTEVVYAMTGPADPVSWLTSEPDVSMRRLRHWMLRVIDPAAAVAARGFPATAQAQVGLRLTDANLPGNAGRYTLSVSGGLGTLIRDGTGRSASSPASSPVTFGPRGFAALYGGLPMATLRAVGLTAGGDRDADAALDSVFGAQSFLLDYF
jgi:GNAT superfamily N-acetyltransferase